MRESAVNRGHYTGLPRCARGFSGAVCDRRRPLWLHRSRGSRHDRRGTLALDRGLRALRDRLRRDRLLPGPARPHRRGVADEVRLPLRLRGAVGPAAAALPRGAPAEAARRASSPGSPCSRSRRSRTRSSAARGSRGPFVAAAPLPLLQAPENVSATALLLRGRYDLRGLLQTVSMGLRLARIAIGVAVRRRRGGDRDRDRPGASRRASSAPSAWPRSAASRARRRSRSARTARGIVSFVLQSSVATGLLSLRAALAPLLLGVVAGPTQVGLFRIAQAPQSGFAAASSPVRLILLTEQTRDWERGRRARACSPACGATRCSRRR